MVFVEAIMVTKSATAMIDEAVPPFRKSILKLNADIFIPKVGYKERRIYGLYMQSGRLLFWDILRIMALKSNVRVKIILFCFLYHSLIPIPRSLNPNFLNSVVVRSLR